MKKFFIFLILFESVFAANYFLSVKSSKDIQVLKKIGLNCKKYNSYIVCLQNDNLDALKRVKDFLKNSYHIKSYIVKADSKKTVLNNTSVKIAETIKNGYCIQLVSSIYLKPLKRMFLKYKSYPYSRIEKINNFYVLRIGEGKYENIKKLYNEIDKGFIRKCDLKPERIVESSFHIKKPSENNTSVSIKNKFVFNTQNSVKQKYNLAQLYYYFNNGDLINAKKAAFALKSRYPYDSKFVLGLIAMKNNNFGNACTYLRDAYKLKPSVKLLKTKNSACYTFYLKKGYTLLNINPKEALFYFQKAQKINNNKDVQLGLGYAYMNLGDFKKSRKILQNLYKKYPSDVKIINAYANLLVAMKDYKTLKKLQSVLPDNIKKKLSSVEFYMNLQQAKTLMKNKNYPQAEMILKKLYLQNPGNVPILLTLGGFYLQTGKLNVSENFYNNVLVNNPQNIYALEGLEAVYMKRGNFEKALKYSDKIVSLGFTDPNREKILQLLYMKKALAALKKNDTVKAMEYLKQAQQYGADKSEIFMMIGDIYYKKGNLKEAYKYYVKAYTLNRDNFNIKMKFLYSLMKLHLYNQIKLILSNINPNKLTAEQKEKLKQFYNDLYVNFTGYLLNNNNYEGAVEAANEGLYINPHNYELYSFKGWACYHMKNYKCAVNSFSEYLKYKKDDKVKYGLALSYINLHRYNQAKKILDSIVTTNPDLQLKVAKAYLLLGDTEKANKIVNNIKITNSITNKKSPIYLSPFEKRKFIFPYKLNDNGIFNNTVPYSYNSRNTSFFKRKTVFIKQNTSADSSLANSMYNIKKEIALKESARINNIFFGLKYRHKSGNSGTSQLSHFSFPYVYGTFFVKKVKLFAYLDHVNLDAGTLNSYSKIGTQGGSVINKYHTTSHNIDFGGGIEYINLNKGFKLFAGRSGGRYVSPNLIYGLKFFFIKKAKYSFFLYRKSVKDSILSYEGNTDPYSNNKWGNVTENGILFSYKRDLDKNGSFLYADLNFASLNGKNVKSNFKTSASVLPMWYQGNMFLDADYLGFFAMIESYERDENSFVFGKGGYYSPQLFLLLAPKYTGYWYNNKNFYAKFFMMAGLIYSNNSDNDTSSDLGVGFDGGGAVEWLIGSHFGLFAGMDIRKNNTYTDFFGTLGIKWFFGRKKYILRSEIDNFAKRITAW